MAIPSASERSLGLVRHNDIPGSHIGEEVPFEDRNKLLRNWARDIALEVCFKRLFIFWA